MAQKMSAISVKSQYAILERCASDLQECVREMHQEFQESQVPITDDDSVFHRFCAKLEFLLQHRIKEKSGLLSGKKNYWDYFCRCLVSHKTSARDGIKFVKSVSEFKTAAGKGRAFLRFCLVHQCLADTLQQCLSDVPATTEFYHPDGALFQSQLASNIVSALYDLSAVQFDLAPTGYDLDVAFPSFARKIYGTPPSWRASTPSRTLSMSSFSFSTPQSLSSSFPRDFMASSENGGDDTGASSGEPDMEQQVQQLQLELARMEGVKTSLCMSVSTLGEERQVLEDKVAELERVLAQVRKNAAEEKEGLESKVTELEDRLSAYQNEAPVNNNKMEALERMNAELSIRLATTEGERDDMRDRLEQVSALLLSGKEQCKMYEVQVTSLKEAATLSRQMLAIRDQEVRDLRQQVAQISETLQQIEEYKLFSEERAKWSAQLKEIKTATQELHMKWSTEKNNLETALEEKERLYLATDAKCVAMTTQLDTAQELVDSQQRIVEKLQNDLVTTLDENKKLDRELKLIQDLLRHLAEEISDNTEDEEWDKVLACHTLENTTCTFLQVRDLVVERRQLNCELLKLKEINSKLELAVSLQERRLSTVTMELNKTWSLISKLKTQHGQLHTSECVLRYELSEKRKYLNRLKEELETWRQKWASIREKNEESEQAWQSIRNDFDARKASTVLPVDPSVDLETKIAEDACENVEENTLSASSSGAKPKRKLPPIDLVSDIETQNAHLGASSEEESEEDERGLRLRSLEEQSRLLYSKLMSSTTRSINLAAKLAQLHEHYGASEPTEDEEQEDGRELPENLKENTILVQAPPTSIPTPPPLPPTGLYPTTSPVLKLACKGDTLENAVTKREEECDGTNNESMSLMIQQLPQRVDVLKQEKRLISDQLKTLDLRLKVLKNELDRVQREKDEDKQTSEEQIKAFEAREKDLCDQVRSLKEEMSTLQFQLSTQTLEYEKTAQAYKEHQDIFQVLEERVEKQNALVKELEQLLAEVKRERDIERTESAAQMETMRSLLATREEECQGLSQELKECSVELNELRVTNKKMDEELRTIKTDWAKKESEFQSDVTLLRDESVQLRHKIIKLIKEKDMLWQRTDRLLHLQRVQASDMWMPDHEVSCCLACRVTFTFLLRKHHCRLCGRIFCHRCADNWIMTAASNRRARVCNECFIVHRDMGSETSALVFSQDSDVGDGQEQQESSELFQSDSSPNSSSVSSPPTTSHMLCLEMGNKPESNEGTFAVLSDEEITRSLSESSPYAQSPLVRGQFEPGEVTCSLLRTVKEIEDCEEIGEAWVNAGMVYKVPIAVDVSGIVLHWEFQTEPKSLSFSVIYECTEDEEENRILVETTHVTSHLQSVEGSLTCQKPGTYCLLFDNSLSRYLAKKITYQLSVSRVDESCKEETSDTG